MTSQEFKDIFFNGVWKQNTGIVQLLGLCPILAISSSVVNAVSLGLATALVMTLSGAAIAPIRNLVPNEARIPIFVLIIAVLVTIVQFCMNAYFYGLYIVLGIFIPLIVTNCIVLARIEAFASKNPILHSTLDVELDFDDSELELLEERLELLLLELGSGEVGLSPHPKRGARPAIAAPPERRIRNSRRSPSAFFRLLSCSERPASASLKPIAPASNRLSSSIGRLGMRGSDTPSSPRGVTRTAWMTALLPGWLVTQTLSSLAASRSTRDGSTPTPVRAIIFKRPPAFSICARVI